jgi:hypothetical protein
LWYGIQRTVEKEEREWRRSVPFITTGTKQCRFPHWEASPEVVTEIAAHTEFGEAEVAQGNLSARMVL